MTRQLSKKVCLLGDFSVGKTSMIRRFVFNMFDDKYLSTIGVKVSRKTVVVPQANDVVELMIMLWDLAGSHEFNQMQASYYRGAAGAMLVGDLTRLDTIENLHTYANNFLEINPNASLVLAANKYDLIQNNHLSEAQPKMLEQIKNITSQFDMPYYLTSAKTGDAVETVFRHLAERLVSN